MEDEEIYAPVVDKAIELGLEYARKHGRAFDIMHFALAIWLAKPVIERERAVPAEERRRKKLVDALMKAVYQGDKSAVGRALARMFAFGKDVGLAMPTSVGFPKPKAMLN